MKTCTRFSAALLSAFFVVTFTYVLAAQEGNEPVPTPIISAKKAFVSNMGIDTMALQAFQRVGYTPYGRFCTEMKKWGRYDVVTDPSQADLIFEVRFLAPIIGFDPTSYAPQLQVRVLDAKTHFALWTVNEPMQGAFRQSTWNKNFDTGMSNTMAELKKIAGPPSAHP